MEEVRQVGPHETFPFVEWDVLSWRAELPAGVADKDVDRPASLAFSVHGDASGGLIGDVEGQNAVSGNLLSENMNSLQSRPLSRIMAPVFASPCASAGPPPYEGPVTSAQQPVRSKGSGSMTSSCTALSRLLPDWYDEYALLIEVGNNPTPPGEVESL